MFETKGFNQSIIYIYIFIRFRWLSQIQSFVGKIRIFFSWSNPIIFWGSYLPLDIHMQLPESFDQANKPRSLMTTRSSGTNHLPVQPRTGTAGSQNSEAPAGAWNLSAHDGKYISELAP